MNIIDVYELILSSRYKRNKKFAPWNSSLSWVDDYSVNEVWDHPVHLSYIWNVNSCELDSIQGL